MKIFDVAVISLTDFFFLLQSLVFVMFDDMAF